MNLHEENLKILVCGMPRSMTTWAFNVINELLERDDLKTIWIEPGSNEESQFLGSGGVVIGKCHHFDRSLAAAADLVVYSYRDVRTAAVSCMRKFGTAFSLGQIETWIQSMQQWMPHSTVVLRYEAASADPLLAIARLRSALFDSGSICVTLRSDGEVLERVDCRFRLPQAGEARGFDSRTMVHLQHRTFQPPPEALQGEDRELFDKVESAFRPWLIANGYLSPEPSLLDDYGQESEFLIAAKILGHLGAGTSVVDVGVERGSFTELALRMGASSVLGIEALPRHHVALSERFRADSRVRILPVAASNSSGVATFHIATDRDGKELDFHHSLSDLGDSGSVIRSTRSIEVETAALGDLFERGVIADRVDLLKIDTDGHDLAVLQGLGNLRPSVILAEYWDSLPETSGVNSYTLRDLVAWGREHGYRRSLTIRRNRILEVVEFDCPWSAAGDWGNVFLFRDDFALDEIAGELESISLDRYQKLLTRLENLVQDCEQKEFEIRRLDASLREARSGAVAPVGRSKPRLTLTSNVVPGEDPTILMNELVEKEWVIQQQRRALLAYRAAFFFVRPVMPLIRRMGNLSSLLYPKLGSLVHHAPLPLNTPAPRLWSAEHIAPRISIVTPSFRQAGFIEATLCSVLDQGYPNLEYVVQDGGSDDGTVEVLERFTGKLAGWVSEADGGQSQAINLGFAQTSGEIMAWLNSDDLLMPGALALVAEYFASHPEVDVVYGHRILIDEEGHEIGRWVMPPHSDKVLSWADFVPQETLFWRRSLWEKVGGIDESFRFAMDWDLLLRFRDAGARMVRLPYFLGAFRIHEAQKTSAQINEVGMREMTRLRQRALGRAVTGTEIRAALLPYLARHIGHDLAFRIKKRMRNSA